MEVSWHSGASSTPGKKKAKMTKRRAFYEFRTSGLYNTTNTCIHAGLCVVLGSCDAPCLMACSFFAVLQ